MKQYSSNNKLILTVCTAGREGRKNERKERGEKILTHKLNIRSYEKQHGGCEAQRMNPTLGQRRAPPDTCQTNPQGSCQDQIVQSGNYCHTFLRVASIDKVKILPSNYYHDSHTNVMFKQHRPSHSWKRGAFCWVWSSGPCVWKIDNRTQTQTKLS